MPADSFPNLDRFLRGVHRRLILLRLIEYIGIAVAISCAVALPLVLLLAWRGTGSTAPALMCLAVGVLAGVAWGATQLPSALDAAMEADRQLHWADLLGSALLLRTQPDDQWHTALLVTADRRCRGRSPSSVLLRRLTARAWSGIALVLTLTLALSAWIGSPATSLARDARALAGGNAAGNLDVGNQPLLAPIPLSGVRPSAAPPDGQDAASDGANASAPDRSGGGAQNIASPDGGRNDAAASDGQADAGRTSPENPGVQVPDARAASSGSFPAAKGKPTGGDGSSIGDAGASGGTVGGTVGGVPEHHANAPWGTDQWAREVTSAQQALATGAVPAPFRDLVREYFRRE